MFEKITSGEEDVINVVRDIVLLDEADFEEQTDKNRADDARIKDVCLFDCPSGADEITNFGQNIDNYISTLRRNIQ